MLDNILQSVIFLTKNKTATKEATVAETKKKWAEHLDGKHEDALKNLKHLSKGKEAEAKKEKAKK